MDRFRAKLIFSRDVIGAGTKQVTSGAGKKYHLCRQFYLHRYHLHPGGQPVHRGLCRYRYHVPVQVFFGTCTGRYVPVPVDRCLYRYRVQVPVQVVWCLCRGLCRYLCRCLSTGACTSTCFLVPAQVPVPVTCAGTCLQVPTCTGSKNLPVQAVQVPGTGSILYLCRCL